jgi:hypothetical protein
LAPKRHQRQKGCNSDDGDGMRQKVRSYIQIVPCLGVKREHQALADVFPYLEG